MIQEQNGAVHGCGGEMSLYEGVCVYCLRFRSRWEVCVDCVCSIRLNEKEHVFNVSDPGAAEMVIREVLAQSQLLAHRLYRHPVVRNIRCSR